MEPIFEIVFDNVVKPINIGVIIRLACATGSRLFFTGNSVDYRNRKALLAAVGYEEMADLHYEKDFDKLIRGFRQEGKRIVGTSPRGSRVYSQVDFRVPTVMVFGNEASGLSKHQMELMDELIHIPMPGQVESLNVVNAAAVVLYEGLRQRDFK